MGFLLDRNRRENILNFFYICSFCVFLSLGEDLNSEAFIQEREEQAFSSVQDFVERLQIPLEETGLSVTTDYFLAYGQVVQGDLEYNFETLIHRSNKGATKVISRSLGQF